MRNGGPEISPISLIDPLLLNSRRLNIIVLKTLELGQKGPKRVKYGDPNDFPILLTDVLLILVYIFNPISLLNPTT